jgi:MFS family permease
VALIACASAGLAAISYYQLDTRWIFGCLFLIGVARAFQQPARAALLPLIVPSEHFNSAVTWNSTGFHMASVLGPAAGGFFIKWFDGPTAVYIFDLMAAAVFVGMLAMLRLYKTQVTQRNLTLNELSAGFRFIRRQQVVLGAMLLDLFAVLLGGAVTLLPVFAEDILMTGPEGLGWMRAAPALGALMMAMIIAHRPPLRRTGFVLLWSVVGFGIATIVFGMSKLLWLSLFMLFLTGAFDNISVVIRHTLVQTLTPDHLRGRVSAVNGVFIGASNELGGFESGVVAHWFGPVVSVVSGGIGTIAVVCLTAMSLPQLRKFDRIEGRKLED